MADPGGKKSSVRNVLTIVFVVLTNALIVAILYQSFLAVE
jgi:hypothetical protein